MEMAAPSHVSGRIEMYGTIGLLRRGRHQAEGEFWADKLMDLANLSAVVFIFGQFVTEKIHWNVVIGGVILYILMMVISDIIRR